MHTTIRLQQEEREHAQDNAFAMKGVEREHAQDNPG
jgi:hypothetical protein